MSLVPPLNFLETVKANVDNDKLSDAEFREFIRNSLPCVNSFDFEKYSIELRELHLRLRQAKQAFDFAWQDIPVLTATDLALRGVSTQGKQTDG